MNRLDALDIFNEAVKAVQPGVLLPEVLKVQNQNLLVDEQPYSLNNKKLFLLSVGKAAAAMAQEAEKILGDHLQEGLVVTKYHHSLPLQICTIIEAGHPVPDENSLMAANAINFFLSKLTENDLLIVCISGGASALIADVEQSISLSELQQCSSLLLQSGAEIHEMNAVRKNISTLKGGGLVKNANNATVISLIISDVPGDDLSIIASGLTVKDSSTPQQALAILKKYDLVKKMPLSITECIEKRMKANDDYNLHEPAFEKATNKIIGSNHIALQAAAARGRALGYNVAIINEHLQGDAQDEAAVFTDKLLAEERKNICYLMGGETTVVVKGNGKGGRNQQFALSALLQLQQNNVQPADCPVILSGGTDGTDGPTDAAGSVIDEDVLKKVLEKGISVKDYLSRNDAWHFFEQTGGLIITGPTQTNVMDIVVGMK